MLFGRRYRATEKIGTGGMADVYKAVDEVLGRTVAVKVLHPKYASDPSFTARFRQEAQAAANLTNPHIVNIYDWGQDAETYYIVMEYVRGTDLKEIIVDQGKLPAEKVADIGAQVCQALSVAHGYDIIHRDIKPHNIMVQPDGTVKVMDFGIARAGNSNMTQTGSVLGTAHYVSPEQAQGKPLTAASDLYSLGIVLYEAATGRVPFDGDTPVAVALKQVNDEPRPPRTIDPTIPHALEAVIMRAMAKRPADRYASADEMRKDLLAIARGDSPAVAAAAAGYGVAGETAVMPAVTSAAARGTAGGPPRKSAPVWPWVVLAVVLVVLGLGVAYAMGVIGNNTVMVPDLTSKSVQAATATLAEANLIVGSTTSTYSATAPAGTIVSQDPPGGTKVKKQTAVNLVVSKGVQQVKVPSVVGLPETQAFGKLQAAGLSPMPGSPAYSNSVAAGNVITQSPVAGAMVDKGTAVTYIVSKGVHTGNVPDVVGKSKSTAISVLEGAGFKVSSSSDYSDNTPKGDVMNQTPDAGASAPLGSTVKITVSLGPSTVTVPNVLNFTEAAAKTKINDAGLVPSVQYQSAVSTGTVLSQSPLPGQTAKRGDTVTIVVGQ